MRLIDANELKDFFFSETSGTEEIIHDLMSTHRLDYANGVNEDSVMDFATDLLKKVQNVIDTQPTAYDPDKVVEQLEDCISDTEDSLTGKGARWAYKGAIEIVKGGGVDA